jgi:hypothetical protein
MQCPPEIAAVICDILRTGLLRIRAVGDAQRSVVESDHLHNLPDLLTNYKPELLDYYLCVERVSFIERSTPEDINGFEPLWKALANHATPAQSQALAS